METDAGGVDLADTVVVGVGHVEVAPAVQGNPLDCAELRGGCGSAVAEIGAAGYRFDPVEGARSIGGQRARTRRPPPGNKPHQDIGAPRLKKFSTFAKRILEPQMRNTLIAALVFVSAWSAAGQTKLSRADRHLAGRRLPRAVSPRVPTWCRARSWMRANGFDRSNMPTCGRIISWWRGRGRAWRSCRRRRCRAYPARLSGTDRRRTGDCLSRSDFAERRLPRSMWK